MYYLQIKEAEEKQEEKEEEKEENKGENKSSSATKGNGFIGPSHIDGDSVTDSICIRNPEYDPEVPSNKK